MIECRPVTRRRVLGMWGRPSCGLLRVVAVLLAGVILSAILVAYTQSQLNGAVGRINARLDERLGNVRVGHQVRTVCMLSTV